MENKNSKSMTVGEISLLPIPLKELGFASRFLTSAYIAYYSQRHDRFQIDRVDMLIAKIKVL